MKIKKDIFKNLSSILIYTKKVKLHPQNVSKEYPPRNPNDVGLSNGRRIFFTKKPTKKLFQLSRAQKY